MTKGEMETRVESEGAAAAEGSGDLKSETNQINETAVHEQTFNCMRRRKLSGCAAARRFVGGGWGGGEWLRSGGPSPWS